MEVIVNDEYWVLRRPTRTFGECTYEYLSAGGNVTSVPCGNDVATFGTKKEAKDYIIILQHSYGVTGVLEPVKVTEQYKITTK